MTRMGRTAGTPVSPVILAIECTQREGGVALRDAAGREHVEPLAPGLRHDDELMPAVDRLVRRAGLVPRSLDAVGVSIGPGGFTGLRIAVSTVKMLALALPVRVVAVPTALVVAESVPPEAAGGAPIVVALAAKRDTVWAVTLAWDGEAPGGGGWVVQRPGGLARADFPDLARAGALVADRHLPAEHRARCAALDVPVLEPRFDPRACLRVTARRLDAGETCDPLALLPIYPRPPEAVTIWEQRRSSRPPVQ